MSLFGTMEGIPVMFGTIILESFERTLLTLTLHSNAQFCLQLFQHGAGIGAVDDVVHFIGIAFQIVEFIHVFEFVVANIFPTLGANRAITHLMHTGNTVSLLY